MRRIVIIGGSSGIGNAILELLIDKNEIINISRTEPRINHSNLRNYSIDILTDKLPEIQEIDTLIYCPGSINLRPFSRLEPDDYRRDFEINVIGAIKAIQKYLDALKQSQNPSILLFSTVATKLGMPYHSSIVTSKCGVEGLAKSLAAEFAPSIRINVIAPTVTDTRLASRLLRNDKMKENIIDRHPLKKYLVPKEVAYLADYLISDKSLSVSGQIFHLDSGIVSLKI